MSSSYDSFDGRERRYNRLLPETNNKDEDPAYEPASNEMNKGEQLANRKKWIPICSCMRLRSCCCSCYRRIHQGCCRSHGRKTASGALCRAHHCHGGGVPTPAMAFGMHAGFSCRYRQRGCVRRISRAHVRCAVLLLSGLCGTRIQIQLFTSVMGLWSCAVAVLLDWLVLYVAAGYSLTLYALV